MAKVMIQLALDSPNTARALAAAKASLPFIDIIEAGTVLCLNEGLTAVRKLRDEFTDKPLIADIRIARAGEKFATMAFSAGADRVTVVGEAGIAVIEGALRAAQKVDREVEVELPAIWHETDVLDWVEAGVSQIIAHRFQSGPLANDLDVARTLERLARLDLGTTHVTLAGGIRVGELQTSSHLSFHTVAIGSAIAGASDPEQAAAGFREELNQRAREVRSK